MERAVIIGSGNLAEALARAVAKSGLKLVQIFARNAARGQQVAALAGTQWTADPARLAGADIYLIAVSDRAVAEAAAALPIPSRPSPRAAKWIFRRFPSSSKPTTKPCARSWKPSPAVSLAR